MKECMIDDMVLPEEERDYYEDRDNEQGDYVYDVVRSGLVQGVMSQLTAGLPAVWCNLSITDHELQDNQSDCDERGTDPIDPFVNGMRDILRDKKECSDRYP